MARLAFSFDLKFTNAQYLSGNIRMDVTAPYLKHKHPCTCNSTFIIYWFAKLCDESHFENIVLSFDSVTSGNTLPTHSAVRPSGFFGLKTITVGKVELGIFCKF